MNTKTINTRIGLKYDLYANWVAVEETFVPLKGEVIFYEIPASTGAVAQEPAILFKVGDGVKELKDLPWGSAIAADVYAWGKQQSLLGGTETATGTWDWSTDAAYKQEQDEVAAFIKKETANIKIKVEQLGESAGTDAGKYQTYISNDGGNSWEATGSPFEIELTDYTAGHGIKLDAETNKFSIKLKEGEDKLLVDENGLSAKVAEVTYTTATTGEDTTTAANLTATEGLLDETAVAKIKSYVDAKASDSQSTSAVTVEKLTTAEEGYVSSYVVKQNGTQVGATINIPKDYLVKDATVKICETENNPVEGLVVGDKYIDFEINTATGDGTARHIYLPVKDLVKAYEGGNTNFINVAIDENNVITATAKTQLISGASGRTYEFTSYSAATDGVEYSTGKVEVVKVEGGKTYVKVIENNPDTDFVGKVYYVNSVFETDLPQVRLQLNEGSAPIDVWVALTSIEGSDVDGLATALDVKRYVEGYVGEQLAANVPNVEGQEAIKVTDGTNSKTVSLKLNDTDENPSGLKQSTEGLEINDTITWILNCGGAGIQNNQ